MMWFYHEKLRNFNIYFISNNSLVLVLVLLFDMANTI